MNWMDILVIIVLVLELFKCFRQGMVKSVVEIAGWIVALVTAKLYYLKVATYLTTHFKVFQDLEPKILQGLSQHMNDQAGQAVAGNAIGQNVFLPKILNALPGGTGQSLNQMVYGDLAHRLATMIIHGLSFMAIVMAVMAVLGILTVLLDTIMKLPLLKEVNRMGGLGIGLIKGVFSVWVLMAIMTFALPFIKGGWLLSGITESSFAIYFYNNNLLLYFIYFLLR